MSREVRAEPPTLQAIAGPAPDAGSVAQRARQDDAPARIDAPPVLTPAPRTRGGGRGALISFLAMVVAPGLAAGLYFLWLAADQYIAVARFAVVEIGAPSMDGDSGGVGLLARAAPASRYNHVAAAFMRSAGGLAAVSDTVDVDAMFRRPEADWLARLEADATQEERLIFWRKQVRAVIDGPSGVVTLRVRAFRPEDAAVLAEALIASTERELNALSQRAKTAALARAQAEAEQAGARLTEAVASSTALRDALGLFDPRMAASETLRLVSGLMARRIEIEGELQALDGALDDDAPQVRRLREQERSLTAQIDALRGALAGGGDAAGASGDAESVAAAMAQFEERAAEQRFAERLHDLAQMRLVEAEIDKRRQSIFLNVFDPPRPPEDSRHPRRIGFTLIAFAGLGALWATLALIWASVADHRMA